MPKPKSTPIYLLSQASAFTPLSAASRTGTNQPSQLFRKDVLHVGKLSHPVDGWIEDFNVDRLTKMVAETNRLIAAGHRPHVPSDHHRYADAESNRGFCKKFDIVGDKVYADVELIGEDAIREASRNQVSVFIEPEFQDGKGNKYGEVITHVCLTPVPVQTGQESFIPIAASRKKDAETIKVPALALAFPGQPNPAPNPGPPNPQPNPQEHAIMQQLFQLISRLTGTQAADAASALQALNGFVATQDKPNPQVVAASLIADVDPDSLEQLRLSAVRGFDSLVTEGKITPDVALSLKGLFVGDKDKPKAMSLSLKIKKALGGTLPMAEDLIEVLRKNVPITLGESTKSQRIAASRQATRDENAKSPIDPDIEARSKNMLGK